VHNYHHKPIKKFDLDGLIHDEAATPRLKYEYIRLLLSQMKLLGYVPRIDISPDFTVDYNERKQYFEFKLSVYGIYIGKKQTECIQGIDGNKVIYTPPNKLKESSTAQV
jgi:hypothetical protein